MSYSETVALLFERVADRRGGYPRFLAADDAPILVVERTEKQS
ncbi:hypothetical protein [Bradyrhizobium iriomotense]|nr:hypothetical protein [Bradyrhizobium iriomotense]